MALDDDALFTAAKGYIYIGDVGNAAPSAALIGAFDPATFGAEKQTVTITGTPTGGTFTLTYSGQTTSGIAYNATASTVQTALEALSNIAVGDISVSGGPGPGTPYVVSFIGDLLGSDPAQMTASAAGLTGGTSPAVTVTTSSAWAGWTNLGHTSRDDLPEFGFDGGDTETKGTWQNEALKEVVTETTVDFMTFQLHQFDETALSLYYGQANAIGAATGEFHVTSAATTGTEKSLLMVVVDGDATIGFYARKASLRRDDSVTMATDEFAALPMRATFLKDGNFELFRWISEDIAVNA